ncbi:alpha/beta fold hydrolase [Paraburkholderia acidisoli]|uniref:Alpha/beta fold hydrolase n=1 Tax=Paraburkholderia acidisoli TaxID=2571748 RepID=A0A7Z2JJJ2_9BURK|nr:alpha/beta fold hydrolase [Paraburkholderia acidisoli]QGZ65379.1 alpha/beta fold hydrolase [Paraburkholderia acidisoli]
MTSLPSSRRAPSQLLFLPGASGNTAFWQPLAERLETGAPRAVVAWPGFGQEPPSPAIQGFDDLVDRVVARIDRPTALIAQSIGGAIAVRAALAAREQVTHLVLAVTSGGIDTQGLGAQDWRTGFAAANPTYPDWLATFRSDLSHELRDIRQPVLLLWGDADPYSPVAVGERLRALLPDARLHVVAGGTHDLARDHAAALAPLVDAHLAR